jgi:hypothetical protein
VRASTSDSGIDRAAATGTGAQDRRAGHYDFPNYRHSSKTHRASRSPLEIGSSVSMPVPIGSVSTPGAATAEKRRCLSNIDTSHMSGEICRAPARWRHSRMLRTHPANGRDGKPLPLAANHCRPSAEIITGRTRMTLVDAIR